MNDTKTFANRAITVGAAIAFGFGAAAASAGTMATDSHDVTQAIVKFGDLNLSNRQGAVALYSRIVAAAYGVCHFYDTDSRDLPSYWQQYACVRKAIAEAVIKVGKPQLFAVYNGRNRQPRLNTVAAR